MTDVQVATVGDVHRARARILRLRRWRNVLVAVVVTLGAAGFGWLAWVALR